MTGTFPLIRRLALVCALALAGFAAHDGAAARHDGYTVIHSFEGFPSDGGDPFTNLVADPSGNLYGTTSSGGINFPYGAIFKITPGGTESVFYTFQPTKDGGDPQAGLIFLNGDLYGTTTGGGTGFGTVFKIAPDGTESLVHIFCRKLRQNLCIDGAYPEGGVVADSAGNLYGTAQYGGKKGAGVVFQISAAGNFKVIHTFCTMARCKDGVYPIGNLAVDSAGNVYGTTGNGGDFTDCVDVGCGVAYRMAPDGSAFKVLHTFHEGTDGAFPDGGPILDSAGNIYSTTTAGGNGGCYGNAGCGTVVKITPDGKESVLYAFKGGMDGAVPVSQLTLDDSGNLYGTTTAGQDDLGFGTVFKLAPDGTETVLHNFCVDDGNCIHGIQPAGSLLIHQNMLYGTTAFGGAPGWGVVFQLPKQ